MTDSYPKGCSVPLHKDKISVVLTMHVSGHLDACFAEHCSVLFLCWLSVYLSHGPVALALPIAKLVLILCCLPRNSTRLKGYS